MKGLQTKVSCIETDLTAIKEKQKPLKEDCSHMTEISKFIELVQTRGKQISMNAESKSFIWKLRVTGKT